MDELAVRTGIDPFRLRMITESVGFAVLSADTVTPT
jgi:hypothetical protein